MEQAGIQEILKALHIHGAHVDEKLNNMQQSLERRMDGLEKRVDSLEKRVATGFDRMGKKIDGNRVELDETKETVDYLSNKNLQHERKLRELQSQQ